MARNNKIQIRRSSTPGESPTGLSAGEMAINTNDGIIFIGQSDTDPTDILYQKFPAVSGITVGNGQVVPTTDGKITLLGGDGIGITRDASNPDSITINSILTYSWVYEVGDPSAAGGASPSTGAMRFKDYGSPNGFIVEFDDSDAGGKDATNFFEQLNQEYNTSKFFNVIFKNVATEETSTYVGGGQSDSYGCGQNPFCDETTFYGLDYNPGLASGGTNFGSIISPGDLVTVELSDVGLGASSYPAGPQSGGIARSYGAPVVPSYGWTAGGSVPANAGDFGINALNQVLANTTQVYFHKSDLDGYDQRDRNLDLSALRSKRGKMTLIPYTSTRGFTAGAVTFTLGGTGSYNGTYYTLDVDEVLIETGTDGITNGTKFNVILDYVTDIPETEITGYVSSYNGLTGAVEGVSSVNGRTGDLDVVTGYTAQADTPTSANTGDFWLDTSAGDLFFYDGSSFIQISGADGATGATGPVGDYVESFNGATGAIEGVSSVNGATGAVNLSPGFEYVFDSDASATPAAGKFDTYTLGDDFISIHETTNDGITLDSYFDELADRGGDLIIMKDDGTEVLVVKDIGQFGVASDVRTLQLTDTSFPHAADPVAIINTEFSDGDVAYLKFNLYPPKTKYVASFNGATGAVEGVSTVNGVTGAIDTSTLTLHVAGISSDGGGTFGGGVNLQDNNLTRSNLKDFSEDVNAIGSVSTNTVINFEDGNVQTVTITGNCQFSFSNPPASGKSGTITLLITNGGSATTTWDAAVKWPGGVAPSLTSSGIDVVSFVTTDGGTNIYGFVGGINFS